MKIEISDFNGNMNGEQFFYWLENMETIFEYKELFGSEKVKLVAMKLNGRAIAWTQNKWMR